MGSTISGRGMIKYNDTQLKGLAIYQGRLQDLLNDGYHVIVSFNDNRIVLNKLRHHNGNRIVLKLTFDDGRISQTTNQVPVYSEKVC